MRKTNRILLIEDNEGDVELVMQALKNIDQEDLIDVVNDGDKAINFLFKRKGFENKETPSLILLDLNLPKVSGIEILSTIKKDPKLKSIPVIVMTSSIADKDIVETYNLHANCYVAKPVDAREYMQVIQNLVSFWFDKACLVAR